MGTSLLQNSSGWKAEEVAVEATNHTFYTTPVTVRDARSIEGTFSLDKQGFCFQALDGDDEARVLRELEDAVKTDDGGLAGDIVAGLKEGSELLEQYYGCVERMVMRHWRKGVEKGEGSGIDDNDGYRRVDVIDSLVCPEISSFIALNHFSLAASSFLRNLHHVKRE